MHRRKRTNHADHCPQHTHIGASIAIGGIERIADKAAVTGLIGQMPGKIGHLPLKPPQRRAGQRHTQRDTGIRHRQPRGEIVGAIQHHICPGQQISGIAGIDLCGFQLLYTWLHCLDIRGVKPKLVNVPDFVHESQDRLGLTALFDSSDYC